MNGPFARHAHPALVAAARLPSRVAVGDCGGNDYLTESIQRATQCFPNANLYSPAMPGMPAFGYPGNGYNTTMGYPTGSSVPGAPGSSTPGAPGSMRACGFGGLPMTCGKLPFRVSYVAGLAPAVAAGATSGGTSVTPKVPFKGLRLVIPGASNWRVTSIQVGLTEYIGSTIGVPGTFFQDLEVDSGRIDLDWSSPSLPIVVTATNIAAAPLDFNPGVAGILAN